MTVFLFSNSKQKSSGEKTLNCENRCFTLSVCVFHLTSSSCRADLQNLDHSRRSRYFVVVAQSLCNPYETLMQCLCIMYKNFLRTLF